MLCTAQGLTMQYGDSATHLWVMRHEAQQALAVVCQISQHSSSDGDAVVRRGPAPKLVHDLIGHEQPSIKSLLD